MMHLVASAVAWFCCCWCLAAAFSRGGSRASVSVEEKNLLPEALWGSECYNWQLQSWCRARAATSAAPALGWRCGGPGTESLCASRRSVLKLGPWKRYSTDALSFCPAFEGRIPESFTSPAESCCVLLWSGDPLPFTAGGAEAQVLN